MGICAGERQGAISDLGCFVEIDPSFTEANVQLSIVAKGHGVLLGGALNCLERAQGQDPKKFTGHSDKGVEKLEARGIEGAVRCYEKVIRLDSQP